MLDQHMKNHYGLAYEMQGRARLPYWLKWIREIFIFLQYVFFVLDFCHVDELCTREYSLLSTLNNVFLLNTGVYTGNNSLGPVIIVLLILISTYLLFTNLSKRARQDKYLYKFGLLTIALLIDFVTPIFQVQIFIRPIQITNLMFHTFRFKYLLSNIISIFDIVLFTYFEYIRSVFIKPRIFIIHSLIDNNTGSSELGLYFGHILLVYFQFLLAQFHSYILEFVFLAFYPAYILLLIFYRLSRGTHISIFGAFLQDGPLFASIFIIPVHFHNGNFGIILSILIISLIVYTLIYTLQKLYLKKYSHLIMSGKIESPWYIPISNALVMRHAAETKADIEVFDNYLLLRMNQDPEEMIEVNRFLGIFRSQRAKLQLILSKWKGENSYYSYQFYVFSRMFESLTKTPQHYCNDLDKLHRHYLISLSLFWQYSNNKFMSVLYGIRAALAFVELVDLVKYLAHMYENDSSILMSYAEICLIALGDPKLSVKYRRISSMIKDSPNACEDPIFRHVSRFYPLSVDNYQSENFYSTTDSNSNSSSTESFSKLRFHINENVIFRDEKSDNSSVAMFVRKCTDLRTFGIILSFITILAISMFCLKNLKNLTEQKFKHLEGLKLMISQTIEVAYRLTSGVLLYDQLEQNKNLNCKDFIKKVYNHLTNYPFSYKDDYFFMAKVWGTTSEILSDQMINNCNLFENHSTIIFQQLHQILINYNFFQGNLTNVLYSKGLSCLYKKTMIIMFLMSFVCVFISIGFVYFSTRLLLARFPKEAKEFLGSRERLSLLLLKKSLESWDLFKLNFKAMKEEVKQPVQIAKSPRRIKVGHKFSSETNLNSEQKSRHVDLKDGKISISFIGADQLLKPSQFALMSPFIFSPTPKTTDSSDSEEDEKLIPSEKLENMNLISKTIEKTKNDYKFGYLYIVIIFMLPWIITWIMAIFGQIVIFFEIDVTKVYLTRIDQNATELSKLPYAIYENFKNKTIRQINFNQNLSWYRRNLIQIIDDADQIHKSIIISRRSFLIMSSFFWLLAMYGCFVVEESIKKGYESLFHFPVGLMDDIILQNDTKSESLMTNQIIEVSVNKETNNIICVTSNCLDIIGEEPLNMIGRKYDEIFAKTDNLRLYNLTSKKVKKFVECCYEMNKINKYALYDVSTYLTTKTAMMNLMQNNIPKNFAEKFCEKQKQCFKFSNSYTIIVKYDTSDYSMSTDNFFKSVSNMLQCYNTVKFVKYEGSLCYFICPTCERVIPFLFLRDLIENSRPPTRVKLVQSKSTVISAIILRSDVKYNLEFGEEPYISSNLSFPPFFAKDGTIAVLDKEQFLIRLEDLDKFISAA